MQPRTNCRALCGRIAALAGCLLTVGLGLDIAAPPNAAEESGDSTVPSSKRPALTKKWTVLHLAKQPESRALADDSPVQILNGFKLQGPSPPDPNRLGSFQSNGDWEIVEGWLQRTRGTDTAIHLGRAADFEMEGIVNAEGLGGWFMALGWDKDHGYVVYNVQLKVSGSPWMAAEFRNSKGIDDTHREFSRFSWKGEQPLRMSVVDRKLTLLVGETRVADEIALPNYSEGDIILGTYKTQYGPKPVRIQSLRIRAK